MQLFSPHPLLSMVLAFSPLLKLRQILLALGISALLVACSGNQTWENRFGANPSLNNSPTPNEPSPSPTPKITTSPEPSPSPTPTAIANGTFNDLGDLGAEQRRQIEDLASLGIVSAKTGAEFAPNQTISRGEFARWLFQANNIFFANQPSKLIRGATANSKGVFADVPSTNPNFSQIQGLADAGLIPSSLTNDASASLFRPDAPLTREDLILWKVPLDQRGPLPNASLDNLKETWGFQDTGKINPKVWPALLADFQNGDRANLRRVFGFTTIFQPQRPVTRTEAALSLWFLGAQTDGLSAQDVLNTPTPSPEAPTPLDTP